MMRLFSVATLWLLWWHAADAQVLGSDYLDDDVETDYTTAPFTFQNEDYDVRNSMFIAHPIWVEDRLTYFYKFRTYSVEDGNTEQQVRVSPSGVSKIPTNKLYLMVDSIDNFEQNVVGKPILAHHHIDNELYSDICEVLLVRTPNSLPSSSQFYEPDYYKSVGDIEASGMPIIETGIYVNMPLVPWRSKLQDPRQAGGTIRAPIDPVNVWYRRQEVQTFVFETTDARIRSLFSYTRTESQAEQQFGIIVNPNFWNAGERNWITIRSYFLNQYKAGVVEGVNNGGPNPEGMRNIVPFTRGSASYSPLWQIQWMESVPINFAANQASRVDDLTRSNGFVATPAPMIVNCPLVGSVSSEDNPDRASRFLRSISTGLDSNRIQGSRLSMRFTSGIVVEMVTQQGSLLASQATSASGVYSVELLTNAIPQGTTVLTVRTNDENFRTIDVKDYLNEAPVTWYDDPDVTHFNFDYDAPNKLFLAYPTWYNNRLTHMYKFTTYAAQLRHPELSSEENTVGDIPLNRLYVVTENDIGTVVGSPILALHHVDGSAYSDFAEIIYVRPPTTYIPELYRSEGDVLLSGYQRFPSGIYVNIPLVPNGARLQNPALMDTDRNASLANVPVANIWYKGVRVQAFPFEASEAGGANYFDPTQSFVKVNRNLYDISTRSLVEAPLYFMNHFTTDTPKTTGGGPSLSGMRNIIATQPGDSDYSSLWNLEWVTELPLNYQPDQVSSAEMLTEENGFAYSSTRIWMNGPILDMVSGPDNTKQADSFQISIPRTGSSSIEGSDVGLAFLPGVPVVLQTPSGNPIQTSLTNYMGAYEYDILSAALPNTATELDVVVPSGLIVRTVGRSEDFAPTPAEVISGAATGGNLLQVWGTAVLVLLAGALL